jgi:hypothetical protein
MAKRAPPQSAGSLIFDRHKQLGQRHRAADTTVNRPVIDDKCPSGLFKDRVSARPSFVRTQVPPRHASQAV